MKKFLGISLLLLLLATPFTASALQYELAFEADAVGLVAGAVWDYDYIVGGAAASIGTVYGSVIYSVPAVDPDEDSIAFSYNLYSNELDLSFSWSEDDALIRTLDTFGFAAGSLRYQNEILAGEGAILGFVDWSYPWQEGVPLTDDVLPTTLDFAEWDYGLFGYVGGGITHGGALLGGVAGLVTSANISEYQSVPEPATMLLLGTGLIGMAALGRKRYLKK
jgi:hypothetical protein